MGLVSELVEQFLANKKLKSSLKNADEIHKIDLVIKQIVLELSQHATRLYHEEIGLKEVQGGNR